MSDPSRFKTPVWHWTCGGRWKIFTINDVMFPDVAAKNSELDYLKDCLSILES